MVVNDNSRVMDKHGALKSFAGKPAQGLRRFHPLYPI